MKKTARRAEEAFKLGNNEGDYDSSVFNEEDFEEGMNTLQLLFKRQKEVLKGEEDNNS